jgi:uncharacterized 2Fe-2S/4Fe-4S cluster protein (DUF4445 family)
VGRGDATVPLPVLAKLQPALRKGGWQVTVALWRGGDGPARVLDVWPGLHEGRVYGLAIDVGLHHHRCAPHDLATAPSGQRRA